MIVPLKKVSILVLDGKKEEALRRLRKLGILHLEITEGSGDKLAALKDQIALLERALFLIGKPPKGSEQTETDTEGALALAREVDALAEEKSRCLARRAALTAELDRLKKWGELDPDAILALKARGIDLALCEMPTAEYAALPETVRTLRLCGDKNTVCFLTRVDGTDAPPANYRLTLPKTSTGEMRGEIAALTHRVSEIDGRIAACGAYVSGIKKAISAVTKQVEFEVCATGMATEALSPDGGVTVAYFTGFLEAERLDELRELARECAWGLSAADPEVEDNAPTKLKNNRLVSLVYPLTDFMGTVPGYFEHDISGWFLLFVLIFFGIIFGDGGYGLLITAAAAIPILRSLVQKKTIAPTFLLVGLFGLSTILWGTLTCTWFGLAPEQLPRWLRALSVPVISNVYGDKLWALPWTAEGVGLTTDQNLQIFCFTLALIQLTLAHVICAVKNRKSLKILGDIGSILQLLGIYYLVLNLVVNSQVFGFGLVLGGIPVGTVSLVFIGVGFALSFIFSNYEGSVKDSVLSSLTNIVSVLLGVVNVFSDIVSYIRLWAVGLAGAAISATVNELAGPLLGNFLFAVLAIVLLVFGHGLNMILNVLSVIVHGIRLNTLEFSTHLDMSWSGHKFKPFEE